MAQKRLLSLDGGGVRGLAMLLVLLQVMEMIDPDNPPKPCDYFDLIGGTSTGGLIAIMLGRLEMDVKSAIDAYVALSMSMFKPRRKAYDLFGRASDRVNMKGRFNSSALEKSLKDLIKRTIAVENAELLCAKEQKCRVFVCAIRRENSQPVILKSYRSRRGKEVQCTIWEACRATAAASSFFEPIKIGQFGEEFVDGAVGFNNPVHEVLAEARDLWPTQGPSDKIVVSIGSGQPPLFSFGSTLFEVSKTLSRMATETEKTAEAFSRAHAHMHQEGTYFRFNVPKGLETVGLEEHKKLNILVAATRNYLANQVVHLQMEACATALKCASSAPPPTKVPQRVELEHNGSQGGDEEGAAAHELEGVGIAPTDLRTHDSFQSWLSSFHTKRQKQGKDGTPTPSKQRQAQEQRQDANAFSPSSTDGASSHAKQKIIGLKKSMPSMQDGRPVPTHGRPFSYSMINLPRATVMETGNNDHTNGPAGAASIKHKMTGPRQHLIGTGGDVQIIPSELRHRVRRHITGGRQAHLLVKVRAQTVVDIVCNLDAPLTDLIELLEKKGVSDVAGFRVHGRKGMRIGPRISKSTLNPIIVTDGESSYSLRTGYRINSKELLVKFYNRRFPRAADFNAELLGGTTSSIFVTSGPRQLDIHFKRAPRVPEDGITYQLPPTMENFPLFSADAFRKTLPEGMRGKGGAFFPMLQREAMVLEFTSEGIGHSCFAIRVFAGSVNALTGSIATSPCQDARQDYIVAPIQHFVSGFCVNSDTVKQFVAMPMGAAYSLEKQITGAEYIGGLQLQISPMYRQTVQFGRIDVDPQEDIKPRHLEEHRLNLFSTAEELGLTAGDQFFMFDRNAENIYDLILGSGAGSGAKSASEPDTRPTFVHELFGGSWYGRYDTSSSLLVEALLPIVLHVEILDSDSKVPRQFDLSCTPLTTVSAVQKIINGYIMRICQVETMKINGRDCANENFILDDLDLGSDAKVVVTIGVCVTTYGSSGRRPAKDSEDLDVPGWDMALAAGGNVKQSVYKDENPAVWNWDEAKLINIQILNSVSFHAVTGLYPPVTSLSFEAYKTSLIPWTLSLDTANNSWSMGQTGPLSSVAQCDAKKTLQYSANLANEGVDDVLIICVCCETRLCDSLLMDCQHYFCATCINFYMKRKGVIQCGVCDKRASRAVKVSAPSDVNTIRTIAAPAQTENCHVSTSPQVSSSREALSASIKMLLRVRDDNWYVRRRKSMTGWSEVLSSLAASSPDVVNTALLQMAIFRKWRDCTIVEMGLFQLLLNHVLASPEATAALDLEELVRTCWLKDNPSCLELLLPLYENRDKSATEFKYELGQTLPFTIDFYDVLRSMFEISSNERCLLLNLEPELSNYYHERIHLVASWAGIPGLAFLVRYGFISLFKRSRVYKTLPRELILEAVEAESRLTLLLLKDLDIDLDAVDDMGRTILHEICAKQLESPKNSGLTSTPADKSKIMSNLLEVGCKVDSLDKDNNTILHTACEAGDTSVVSTLVEWMSRSPSDPPLISRYNRFGKTPLHCVPKDCDSLRKTLLDAGADPTIPQLGQA